MQSFAIYSLPLLSGAVGGSLVCDCGIFSSFLLTVKKTSPLKYLIGIVPETRRVAGHIVIGVDIGGVASFLCIIL